MVFNCNANQLLHENAQKKKAVGQIDQRLSLNIESMNGFWLKYWSRSITYFLILYKNALITS